MGALTTEEPAMPGAKRGAAVQKAVELLVRYADPLDADRFVETNNVAGVRGSSTGSVEDYDAADGGDHRGRETAAHGVQIMQTCTSHIAVFHC